MRAQGAGNISGDAADPASGPIFTTDFAARGLCRPAGLSSSGRMKILVRSLLILGSLLAASPLPAADVFEGKVTLGFKSGREKEMIIDYAMKGGLVRIEPQGAGAEGAAMIFDPGKREMIVLMAGEEMYLTMPLSAAVTAAGGKAAAVENTGQIERTGKTETILGYPCEQFIHRDKSQTTEIWATEKLGTFMGLGGDNPMEGMMGGRGAKKSGGGWEQALKGMSGFFPLRVISSDAKGKDSFRLETRSIQPGTLPASLFAPPPGFKKFALPGLGGLLGG